MYQDLSLAVRPLALLAAAFAASAAGMPLLIRLLRRYKMGKSIRTAADAPVMHALHAKKAGTPTMGGMIIWIVTLLVVGVLELGCLAFGEGSLACTWSLWNRAQTWVPIGLMVAAALVGLVDDYLNVIHSGPKGGGLRVRHRLLLYTAIAVVGAWWFYTKLEWSVIGIPFVGNIDLGWWYVPFFILVVVATQHSVNVTDGLDGLAGGTLLSSFAAYAAIAWSQGRFDAATLCTIMIGALMGFLWYNVNPADVFMGDTGVMAMGTVLALMAMLTNTPLLLILIGLPFVVESASVLIQVTSKKLRGGKKVFISAPLHHHLEASGWSEPRIVMRSWMISFVLAGLGTVLALIG